MLFVLQRLQDHNAGELGTDVSLKSRSSSSYCPDWCLEQHSTTTALPPGREARRRLLLLLNTTEH